MPLRLPRKGSPSPLRLIALLAVLCVGCASTGELIVETGDEDAETRREAVAELGARRPDLSEDEAAAAIEAIEKVLDDPDPAVRATATEVLRAYQPGHIEELLRQRLRDPHERVRQVAASAAGKRKVAGLLTDLLRVGSMDESEDVRREAVNAISRIGDPAAIPVLIDMLELEESRVRFVINDALRRLSGKTFPPIAREWQEWYEREG